MRCPECEGSSAYAVMTDSSVTGIIVWYRRGPQAWHTNSLAAANVSMRMLFGGHRRADQLPGFDIRGAPMRGFAVHFTLQRDEQPGELIRSQSRVTRRRVDNSIGVIRYRSFRFVHSVVSLLGFAASRHKAHLAHLTIAQTTGMAMIASPTTSSHEELA